MHDPLVVAFEIRRPWPRGRLTPSKRYWPALITVWHVEPGGHDSGEVCKHYDRTSGRVMNGWRWHVWHWRIQVPALQELRRRLLTRCTWCAGRSTKRDPVNHSLQWDGDRGPWWRGEGNLFHGDCASVHSAHGTCLCVDPLTDSEGWGNCVKCGKFRPFGLLPEHIERRRAFAAVPAGSRPAGENPTHAAS